MCLFFYPSTKMEEKARLEAEAREREEQQLLEEQQRRLRQEEEEAALQKELLRLHQHRAAKKKKKEKAKENTAPPQNNPQPLKQTAQNVLDNLHNGKSRLLQTLIHLPDQETKLDPAPRPNSLHSLKSSSEKEFPSETNAPHPSAGLHNGTLRLEANGKHKAKQPKVTSWEAPAKKDLPKSPDVTVKLANGIVPAIVTESKVPRIRPVETTATPVATAEPRKEDRSSVRSASGKRLQQQQPPNQMKEDRRSPPALNPSPSPPLASQPEQTQQNGKPPNAESPQPKGKTKKNKKKKGDKMNSSIGGSMLRSFRCAIQKNTTYSLDN